MSAPPAPLPPTSPASPERRGGRLGSAPWLLFGISLVGLAAFTYPLLLPALLPMVGMTETGQTPRTAEAPLLLAIIAMGCVVAMLLDVSRAEQSQQLGTARTVAMLGALIAIDASLRLVPSISGASLIFGLIILVGAVFGSRIGFVMGTLTLLLSAAITGGIGPWLPFQMLGAGWVGMGAGLVKVPESVTRRTLIPLAVYAAASGFIYGALLNLYDWPFLSPGGSELPGLAWSPGLGLAETLRRYGAFYLTTSLWHDAARAAANVLFVLVIGPPVVRLLRRQSLHASWSRIDP